MLCFNTSNYTIYRKDRLSTRGGGILICVKCYLNSYALTIHNPHNIELLAITLYNYIIFSVYRPPNMSYDITWVLCNILNSLIHLF